MTTASDLSYGQRPRPAQLRIPFNVWDEGFAHADNTVAPPTVHLAARLSERVDLDRLWNAVHEALRRHPMATARRAPWTPTDAGYEWVVDNNPDLTKI